MKIRGIRLSVAIVACLLALSSTQAAAPPFPGFWPAGVPVQRPTYDFWQVWSVRCEARQSPTTVYNLAQRQRVMGVWIAELSRQGMTVDDVAPRPRVNEIAKMIARGETERASGEVDSIFRGLEEMVKGKEHVTGTGSIAGAVVDVTGAPVPGADVLVMGTPQGAVTDGLGRFLIPNVPCTTPRYVLRARKASFVDGYTGDINVTCERPAEAIVLLEKAVSESTHRAGSLAVKVCRLIDIKSTVQPAAPLEAAVIDAKKYPEQVQPYLKPSVAIDSDNAAVQALAQQILAAVPEPDRTRSTVVAKAVYGWIVRNVAHDLISNFPDDPTGGDWQTTFGAWGRTYQDWCYTASEVVQHKRATGIESERLASALLRCLGIPARPAPLDASPVCQWWVQLPAGNGYWANMETSRGRDELLRTGSTDAAFASVGDDRIAFYSVDERAPIHMTWNAGRACLWLEDYGRFSRLGHNAKGLKAAQNLLELFKEKGFIPQGARRSTGPIRGPAAPSHILASRGFVLDLASLGGQKELTARFPVFAQNQYRATLDIQHWTNHPEWVKTVRREKEQNDKTNESLEWYCIDLDLSAKPPAPEPEPAPAQ